MFDNLWWLSNAELSGYALQGSHCKPFLQLHIFVWILNASYAVTAWKTALGSLKRQLWL